MDLQAIWQQLRNCKVHTRLPLELPPPDSGGETADTQGCLSRRSTRREVNLPHISRGPAQHRIHGPSPHHGRPHGQKEEAKAWNNCQDAFTEKTQDDRCYFPLSSDFRWLGTRRSYKHPGSGGEGQSFIDVRPRPLIYILLYLYCVLGRAEWKGCTRHPPAQPSILINWSFKKKPADPGYKGQE